MHFLIVRLSQVLVAKKYTLNFQHVVVLCYLAIHNLELVVCSIKLVTPYGEPINRLTIFSRLFLIYLNVIAHYINLICVLSAEFAGNCEG